MSRKIELQNVKYCQIRFTIHNYVNLVLVNRRYALTVKRGTAASIVYGAFEQIKEATGNDALEVFETAMDNIMPVLEVRARRVGGSNYQVPVEVRPDVVQLLVFVGWLTHHVRVVNTL